MFKFERNITMWEIKTRFLMLPNMDSGQASHEKGVAESDIPIAHTVYHIWILAAMCN